MVQTKTKRKQKKHGKTKTKKRIYGGVVSLFKKTLLPKLFDNSIDDGEKNDALQNIKRMTTVEDVDTALTELDKKDNSKNRADIYDVLDLRVSNLLENEIIRVLTPRMVKKLPFSNSKMKRMKEAVESSRRNELEMVKLPPLPGARAPTPSIAERVETPAQDPIPGDLSMPQELSGDGDDVGQSEVQDDRGLVVDETVKLSDDVKREADAAVAKSNDTKSQIQQMIKQRETEEAIELFDDANDSLVEIIDAAEEQVSSSKAKSAADLFNVVTGRLQDITKAAEEEVERNRIAAAAEAELKRVAAEEAAKKVEAERIAAEEATKKAEAERIAAEEAAAAEAERRAAGEAAAERERVAAEEAAAAAEAENELKRVAAEEAEAELKRVAAKSLFDSANQSLGVIVGAAEVENESKRVATEQAEAEREQIAAAKKVEEERAAEQAEAEREQIAAAKKVDEERAAAKKVDEERERAAAEELERIAAKKVEEERTALEESERVAAAEELNRIDALNKARLARIAEEERAVAESLLNKANESLEEIITIAERDAAAANLASERPAEVPASAPSSLPEAVIEMIRKAEEGINRMVDSFYNRVGVFEYANLDCENYYELLLYANKAPNNMKSTLGLLGKLLPKTDGIIIKIEENMESIKKTINSIYLISPLYQKDKNVDESLDYYTDNKMKQVRNDLDENIKDCLDNSVIDKERVTEVARLARDQSVSTPPSLNTYIEDWLLANGNPSTEPIQLSLPDNIKQYMPPLEEINPIGSGINKLYVLRTVEELVTIDPLFIYKYEKSILDDKNTIAIIPDYMVNSDGGEISAAELLELLQLYVEIYKRMSKELTDQESITKFEGTYNSGQALLGYFKKTSV